MMYCPPNVTLSEVWVDHGISQCFMETVCAGIIGPFLFIFGIIQIIIYNRPTVVEHNPRRPSKLFGVQLFFMLFIPLLATVRFCLQAYYFNGGHIYGYMIVALSITLTMFPLAAYLAILERRYLLPSVRPQGHGFVLLVFWTMIFVAENMSFINIRKEGWWWHLKSLQDRLEMALFVGRYMSCMIMFVLGLKAPGIAKYQELLDHMYTEQPLGQRGNDSGSTFKNVFYKLRKLLPFLWPKRSFVLQLNVFVCIMALVVGRVVNLYVPIYNKKIVDSLTPSTVTAIVFRWDLIVIYVAMKFLQGGGTGGMGLLNNLRSFLWIPVQQYTTRELQLKLFAHLHELPLQWHLSRKTGEVLRVMERGTDSIDNLLSYILFSIVPTIVDIGVAVVFFVGAFNAWFGLIVFTTMLLYIIATVAVTEWRTKFQRRMNLADNAQKARSVDSLLNYETVKYYNSEHYEILEYREAINKYQKEEFKNMVTLNILNTVQNVIVCTGLLTGSLLCMKIVVYDGTLTVGDYVLFASYIIQLYVPLNWFGTYYRAIQKNFVDMENMFDLMSCENDITDPPGASPINLRGGELEFRDVSFGYTPQRLVLKNVSFHVPSGKTVAIVGPSGAGKSTIVRLVFRFFDVNSGAVLIDRQDVRGVVAASVRRACGVVPQDTVLFNNSIRFNIQYGRPDASTAEVISAAKNADIHERILTFPDGYDTQVGERGLRLSGGEKQRIAIARTLLKDPTIVMLDEATSALDTATERNIQSALARVCQNRTTVIIAHRLSTIIHADQIIVLNEGEIVERGSHEELLQKEGLYSSMWRRQLENNKEESAPMETQSNDNTNNSVVSYAFTGHGHGH